uniref:Uncharacterized protein n=1 Tax=Panagrolaimus sp. PS1159 TaxID=55785 RepID=A0AC35GFP4_9BILA
MIISKELYDKCCPSYKTAIDELEKKIDEIKHSDDPFNTEDDMATKLCETIMKFSNSYLTPREYWKYLMQRIKKKVLANDVEEWKKVCRKIAKRALFHLCYRKEWNEIRYKIEDDSLWKLYFDDTSVYYFKAYGDKHLKMLNFQYNFYFGSGKLKPHCRKYFVTEQDLEYPHVRLQECMHEYEKKSSGIPSAKIAKQYKDNKKLYDKIKSVEHNVKEWFKSLLEVRDIDFVMHNVEYRLGKNLFNIELWKLYIDFLEMGEKYSRYLEVLSLYCRFFMDDEEMKEKYKREMARFGFSGLSLKKVYAFPHDVKPTR